MKMRNFGKLGIKVSAFGVGCMRFPTIERNGKTVVDQELATKIIRTAVDNGVNYIDTAYVYSDGTNESVVAKALADGYREKVMLATKLPPWCCETKDDMQKVFEEQLKALNTDYIDFYLVHSLRRNSWEKMKSFGVCDFLDKLKASGKIKYAAFSFHDNYELFDEIIHYYDWDMCQLQYNFMDIENQAGRKGVELAGELGVPVVVMEGLLGGKLAKAPKEVQKLYDEFPDKRSPAEWSFRWLANHPQIATILSGVSDMEQTVDNLRIFDTVDVNIMTKKELDLMENVRKAYLARTKIQCTGCRYCMPCPQGVEIPDIFSVWNSQSQYNEEVIKGNNGYTRLKKEGSGQDKCIECGACESVCPQGLDIISALKQAECELWKVVK